MGRFYAAVLVLVVFCSPGVRAQVMDCEQTIAFATDEFNAGHFYAVPGILEPCMSNFNRDQRQRAFLLLTQTYLLLDDPIGAKQSFLSVLAANPEFVTDERIHPMDVVYLSKRFTATPRFAWFVDGGTNVTPVRVIHETNIENSAKRDYLLRPGYNLGIGGEYSYNDNLRLSLEANFFQSGYRLLKEGHYPLRDYPETGDIKSVIDRQTWVNVPLYVGYTDNTGVYRPYGYAGISLSYMLSNVASITRRQVTHVTAPENDGSPLDTESLEAASPDFDMLASRNRLNRSIVVGAGVKYKLGLDFVFVDLRYSIGLRNVTNPDFRFGDATADLASPEFVDSATPVFQYGHANDYMRLDNIALTVGFMRPLYKPRELKRARTKSVLRKMKRTK